LDHWRVKSGKIMRKQVIIGVSFCDVAVGKKKELVTRHSTVTRQVAPP
jgi:hypothetical protein